MKGDKSSSVGGHRAKALNNPPQQLGRHGVLPASSWRNERLVGANWVELFTLKGLGAVSLPPNPLPLDKSTRRAEKEVPVLDWIDTPIEVDYYRHGGIYRTYKTVEISCLSQIVVNL